MTQELFVFAGVVACIFLFSMVETLWTIINRPAEAVKRFENANQRFGWSRAHLISALIGYLGFVYTGIYGLLFWTPTNWRAVNEYGEFTALRHTLASLFTFAAFATAGSFERLARVLSDIPMLRQTLNGIQQVIAQAHNLSPIIKSLSGTGSGAPESLREADLAWLRVQADTLQHKIALIVRDSVESERRVIEESAKADLKAAEAKALREREQAKRAKIETVLAEVLPRSPLSVVDALPVGETTEWVTIAAPVVNTRWRKLDAIFGVLEIPKGRERDELRSTDISVALRGVPGIEVPGDLQVVGHYQGSSHGGKTEIVAKYQGELVDLERVVRFEMSLDGLCAAFFFAHILPTYGRFWHSLYDNDYSMLLERPALVAWLLRSGVEPTLGNFQSINSGPGFRVSASGSALRAAALGAGLTTSLTDFSIKLVDGELIDSSREVLVQNKNMVLY